MQKFFQIVSAGILGGLVWSLGFVCLSAIYFGISRFADRRRAERAAAELQQTAQRDAEYCRLIERTADTKGDSVRRPRDWKLRRDFALRRDGHRCTRCGSTISLQVHHKQSASATHDHSGGNLETLCIYCHAKEPARGHGQALLSRNIKSRMKKHHLLRSTSRKLHRCEGCGGDIARGESNYRENYMYGRRLCEKCVLSLPP